jgi:RNA polymerase sigma-70 factor (ECF subfamily)
MEAAERAFFDAVEPLRGGLRLHCYRMLGSSHDGDDVVQETLIRAWRARSTLEDDSRLRPWLYRIATNACLDELKSRPRRAMPQGGSAPAKPMWPLDVGPEEEAVWIEPMPDAWLGGEATDPLSRYTLKESVALAFVAALHVLTPAQRATLLLRDVVGLSAEETAKSLDLSLGAANSALFRARETVATKLGGREAGDFAESAGGIDEALLARYVRAYEEANVDALVALFHEDVTTSMPPYAAWIAGRAPNEEFYRFMLAKGPSGAHIVQTRANARPALAFYRPDGPSEPLRLRAIQVVGVRDGKIANIDHFMLPHLAQTFGLPATWDAPRSRA